MTLDGVDAIVFDFGDTLIPFGEREVRLLYDELEKVFTEHGGPFDDFHAHATRVRRQMIREREATTLREITIEEFAGRVCGRPATARLVRD
ncbi:MAG: hypothetical protein ACE5JG_12710, partial [Planctomycetota bacterium]